MSGASGSPDVAVVGSANVDLVVEVPRRPGDGETLLGGDLLRLPGGKGANQAVAAARCGARVELTACLGEDADGARLLERLEEAGVGTVGVSTAGRPTGTAIILLTPDGENSIVVSPGANAVLDVDRAERGSAAWADAPVVVLSLEIPLQTIAHVAARASAAGARVLVNAAPAAVLDAATLAVCDPLVVNEHEAGGVLGMVEGGPDRGDPVLLAERLLAAGARSAVVTLGAEGSVVAEAGGSTRVPACSVRAVDTTGAGDAFVGAVACELARGAGLVDAVRFATAVSAVSVQRVGAQASYPGRAEVEAFLRAAR